MLVVRCQSWFTREGSPADLQDVAGDRRTPGDVEAVACIPDRPDGAIVVDLPQLVVATVTLVNLYGLMSGNDSRRNVEARVADTADLVSVGLPGLVVAR